MVLFLTLFWMIFKHKLVLSKLSTLHCLYNEVELTGSSCVFLIVYVVKWDVMTCWLCTFFIPKTLFLFCQSQSQSPTSVFIFIKVQDSSMAQSRFLPKNPTSITTWAKHKWPLCKYWLPGILSFAGWCVLIWHCPMGDSYWWGTLCQYALWSNNRCEISHLLFLLSYMCFYFVRRAVCQTASLISFPY